MGANPLSSGDGKLIQSQTALTLSPVFRLLLSLSSMVFVSIRQLHPAMELSTPLDCSPFGRWNRPFSQYARIKRRPLIPFTKSSAITPVTSFRPIAGFCIIFSSAGRIRSSIVTATPKGFPERLITGTFPPEAFSYTENSVGIPGFIFTLQKILSASIRRIDSCMISFFPTETPPVVMIMSACSAISFIFSAITCGLSFTASI